MERTEVRRAALALAAIAAVCLVGIRLLAFAPRSPARGDGPGGNTAAPAGDSGVAMGGFASGGGLSMPGGGAGSSPLPDDEVFEGGEDSEGEVPGSAEVSKSKQFRVGQPGFTGGEGDVKPGVPRFEVSGPVPRYWRFDSHDFFNGRTWERRRPDRRPVTCGAVLQTPSAGSALQHFTVKIVGEQSFTHVIAPLAPWKACLGNVEAVFDRATGELTALRPLPPGSSYAVASSVPPYTPAELRQSGVAIPQDIKARYLQLPASTSKRVRDLASKVTQGASNPYDMAKLIEAHLSKSGNFKYNRTPRAAPEGRDGVDWFLFDSKVGKCDYFASAMVVLLRSVGIPSRMVGGFMPGDWDPAAKKVVIKGPPHAWVEAYFPLSGWVEFEPTTSGDAPGQPSDKARAAPAGLKDAFNDMLGRMKKAMSPAEETPKSEASSGGLGQLEELVPCPGSSRLRPRSAAVDLRDALSDVPRVDILKFPKSLYRKDKPPVQGIVVLPDGRPGRGTVTLFLLGEGGRAEVKVGEGSTDVEGRFDMAIAVPEGWGVGTFNLDARFAALPDPAKPEAPAPSEPISPAPKKKTSWLKRFGAALARIFSGAGGEAPRQARTPKAGGEYPGLQTGVGGSGSSGPRMAGPTSLPDTPLVEIKSALPRYWRDSSYDTYDGIGWSQTRAQRRQVGCDDDLRPPTPNAKRLDISAKVLKGGVVKALFVPLSPVRACAGEIAAAYDGEAQSLSLKNPLPTGARYTASSAVPKYSVEELRAAPAGVSAGIRSRYLQLPTGTLGRIRDLALSVTAGATNNFDKAKLIEAYLGRSGEFTYTLEPPPTPKGRDGVEFFLFDLKRGYCSYFSSAMAVMLRSIGVPARTVSGFAPGRWNPLTQSVILTVPHAWVEVHIPGHGWVEFEPTAGGPAQPSRTSSGGLGDGGGRIPTETNILSWPTEFRRDETPFIAGTVRTLDGKPAGKAEVVVYLSDKHKKQGIRIGQADVDPAGDYRVAAGVPPGFKLGQYQLVARYAGNDDYLCSDSDPEIVIRAEVTLEMTAVPEKGGLRLSGSLKDDHGKPVAGGRVSLELAGGGNATVVTDSAGRFEERIPAQAGDYVVKAVFAATDVYDEAAAETVVSVAAVAVPVVRPKKLPEPPEEPPAVAAPVPQPAPKRSRVPWAVGVLLSAAIVAAVWIRRRRLAIVAPAGGAAAPAVALADFRLDIEFPQIEPDLPLFWGTNDPPLEVVIVAPAGVRVPLTVDGAEKPVPREKGEYVLAAEHGGRRAAKTLQVIDYGEEVIAAFRTLAERHGFDTANLTARQILEKVEKQHVGFRRPEILLTLFERRVYGKLEVSRRQFVDCLRSGDLVGLSRITAPEPKNSM